MHSRSAPAIVTLPAITFSANSARMSEAPVTGDEYESRLALMENWYKELLVHRNRERILLDDYQPHLDFLRSLRGRLLDMGGGAGVAARFLDPDVDYVVADPLDLWNSSEWIDFGRRFRSGGPRPTFVKACGEALPFSDNEFDTVLSYWSLNHVRDAERCIAEMARVLRPGGTARMVIDDVEPSWSELIGDTRSRVWRRITGHSYDQRIPQSLARAWSMKIRGRWIPLQRDHFAIRSSDIVNWASQSMQSHNREWANASLTLDFIKPRT